jgi:2-hydroxychromene-2-carboxylate isomerase
MPTTALLAPPVTFSHSGDWPSHFANQNKTPHNFAPTAAEALIGTLREQSVRCTFVGEPDEFGSGRRQSCANRTHRTNRSIVAKIEDPANAREGPHVSGHIDFFYEFASPYSFIAAQRLPALAERVGRMIRWRPIELQKVWAAQGMLEAYGVIRKAKRSYILTDVKRTADDLGIMLKPPSAPVDATLARLAVYGLEASMPGLGAKLTLKLWRRLWGEGFNISTMNDMLLALPDGIDRAMLKAATEAPEALEFLSAANADAVASSCFGVPWLVADGATYFGQDRLEMLERRLVR